MAMSTLADPNAPVWRNRYRQDLANDTFEAELAAAAANATMGRDREANPPPYVVDPPAGPTTPTTPVDRTAPPRSTQDPTAPRNTNPGGPGVGSGNAPGAPTTSGGRTYGTTPYTDRGSGAITAPGVRYQGFDFTQDPNNRLIGKSAKYTLAEAINRAANAGVGDIWKTKAGAQYFAENYIKPFFEENGFEVLQIVGDKMFVRDYADRAAGRPGTWIDWVVNADGESQGLTPEIAWQPETSPQAGEPTTFDTSRFPTRQDIDGLNRFTPPPAQTRAGMTPDERAYEILARREDRRMARLAGQRGL